MNDFADLRQLLLAYKLGELSSEDREQLDERIIVDQVFSDRIAEAAYDVLDDYRVGRLVPAQRQRVEKAFSQAELRSSSVRESELPRGRAQARLRWFPLGIASLAGLSMGLFLLFIHLHKVQAPPAISATPLAEKPVQQISSATPVAPSGYGPSAVKQSSNELQAVLLLQSGVARGRASSVLELNPSAQVVRVQWVVPDGVTASAFTLSVTQEGVVLKTITQRRNLRIIGRNLVAEFDLAPGVFAKSPEDARFLFIVSADDAPHNVVGEYPVIVRAQP